MFALIDGNNFYVSCERVFQPDRPVLPVPTVSQSKLIDQPTDWRNLGAGIRNNAQTWIFREDSFDAVSRMAPQGAP